MEHIGANEPASSLRSLDVKNAASNPSLNAFSTLQLALVPILFLSKYIWQVAYQCNLSQTTLGEQAF